jgi:NitT/TauT family transport system ATP-binding protein
MMTARTMLSIREVSKTFVSARGTTLALESINVSVEPGEFLCIIGPSGCGKSTLLNLLSGLDMPDSGTILEEQAPIDGPSPHRALMFQEPALFPWLTALDNVAFGLRAARIPVKERRDRARAFLKLVGLEEFSGRHPHELSGGMRQRVALARALCLEPRVLLMDEPFAALDAQTRDSLHEELQAIWKKTGKTIVFVTHNVREALILGDRILLMSARPGRIVREFRFDIARPRHFEDPGIAEAARELLGFLKKEVKRAAEGEA